MSHRTTRRKGCERSRRFPTISAFHTRFDDSSDAQSGRRPHDAGKVFRRADADGPGARTLSAHVIVSPTISKSGATQKYELRIHNEAKVAATSAELEIPGRRDRHVGRAPAAGSYATKKSGDRITAITWQIEVGPNKYVALPFIAKNPMPSRICTGRFTNISPTARLWTGAISPDRRKRARLPR